MAEFISNHRLNDLLIDLGRSLLQYVGESWPWTGYDEAKEQAAINTLVDGQKASVQSLAELLAGRGHFIEPGTYPTEYTSLHYVALDYLLSQLVEDQRELVEECAAVSGDAQDDPDAGPLLAQIADQAAAHLKTLEDLAAKRTARQPA
jgi:hypothetical protein